MRRIALSLITFAALFCLIPASAHAQATRTWVSGGGNDFNSCSRTAPCQSLAGAISKTAAGGEIRVLDLGGIGGATITKTISIVNDGGIAGVFASGTNGIIINAGGNDVINIRGLFIQGIGTGLNGINFLAGKALHVQNCVITGFSATAAGNGNGIKFSPNSASAELAVQDTQISENFSNGVLVQPVVGGSARVVLDRVHMENNGIGFKADATNGGISAAVQDSVARGNTSAGIHAFSPGASAASVFVDGSASLSNGTGLLADTGAGAVIRMNDVSVVGNVNGLSIGGTSQILSFGNNHNNGNVTNGTPTPGLLPVQ